MDQKKKETNRRFNRFVLECWQKSEPRHYQTTVKSSGTKPGQCRQRCCRASNLRKCIGRCNEKWRYICETTNQCLAWACLFLYPGAQPALVVTLLEWFCVCDRCSYWPGRALPPQSWTHDWDVLRQTRPRNFGFGWFLFFQEL